MNPLYIGAGAVGLIALLVAAGSKKTNEETRDDGTRKDMPATDPTDDGFETPGSEPSPEPEVPAGSNTPAAPSKQPVDPPNYGTPPGTYDTDLFQTPRNIREMFWAFGYLPDSGVDDTPMNGMGPDGKLGGDDDVASAVVREFQEHYNSVSDDQGASSWGALDEDGFVGPHTLNALQHAREQAPVEDAELANWWGDQVAAALGREPLGTLDG